MPPILYSFRRCPYAMRARLAVQSSGVECELREIVLRDKAPEFLEVSPKGTVPVVVDGENVIEESLDVMHWALRQNDPEGWLNTNDDADMLVANTETGFKQHLDRYKYASRFDPIESGAARDTACFYLVGLNDRLSKSEFLFGTSPNFADMAIAPFVRQFANVDRDWFDAQAWPHLIRWLDAFLASSRFRTIMTKYPKWVQGGQPTLFPGGVENAS